MMAEREYMALWVCVLGFVHFWLSVSVLRSSVCCQSGNEEAFKEFSEGVIEVYACVGCWVCIFLAGSVFSLLCPL